MLSSKHLITRDKNNTFCVAQFWPHQEKISLWKNLRNSPVNVFLTAPSPILFTPTSAFRKSSKESQRKSPADSWANIHRYSHYTLSSAGNNTMCVFIKNKNKTSNLLPCSAPLNPKRADRRERETFVFLKKAFKTSQHWHYVNTLQVEALLFLYWHILKASEWRSGLRHCSSVLEVSLQTLVRFQPISQPAVIGSPIGRCTIWPSIVWIRVWLEVGRHSK
jgi:hypothetical protein